MDLCPVCSRQVAVGELESHVNVCLDESQVVRERAPSVSREHNWHVSAAAAAAALAASGLSDDDILPAIIEQAGAHQLQRWPDYARDIGM